MRSTSSYLIALAVILASCSTSSEPNANASVSLEDQCEPTSFNAGLGAGTCTHQGTVTLAQFNSELAATQKVAAWQFNPSTLTVRVGQSITAMNNGGEVHTFTEVDEFGGGTVQALNDASGNPVEVPECKTLKTTDRIAAGTTFTTDPATTVGTEHYQCCIHPWMRTTVTVTGS